MATTTFDPDDLDANGFDRNPCSINEVGDALRGIGQQLENTHTILTGIETDIGNIEEGGATQTAGDLEVWVPDGSAGGDETGTILGVVATDNGTVQRDTGHVETNRWDFDGSADYYTIPNVHFLTGDRSFTITFWVEFDDLAGSGWMCIGTAQPGGSEDWSIYSDGTNMLFSMYDGSAILQTVTHGLTLSTGTDYFVCARYNVWTNTLHLNVNDGTEVTDSSGTAPYAFGGAATAYVFFDNNAQYTNGKMEQLAIQNSFISDADCTARYNSGSGSTTWYA